MEAVSIWCGDERQGWDPDAAAQFVSGSHEIHPHFDDTIIEYLRFARRK
jgi:hypothetical protein